MTRPPPGHRRADPAYTLDCEEPEGTADPREDTTGIALLAGTNDLGQDDAGAPARLAALIDRILASDPEVHVLVATVPTSRDGARQARHAAYNNAVINLMGQTARVGVVDTGNLTLADMADPLYPNDNGYDKLGRDFTAGVYALLIQDVLREPRPLPGGGTGGPAGCTDQNTWYPQGVLGNGAGGSQEDVRFADINGDGRDDYIVSRAISGQAEAWLVGGDPFHPTLLPQGVIAWGAGFQGIAPHFGNVDCAGRADYLR